MAPAVLEKLRHRMSQSHHGHDHDDSQTKAAREEEKRKLAEWEAKKEPLEPSDITIDPQRKVVGHSSKVLRKEDFELLKTLGTGTFARVWLTKLADRRKEES
ncbi:hypothetical protein KC346_g9223, partial [Hortaea werneckii]